jgi:hypothetical protein
MGKGLPGGRRQAGRIDYWIEPRSSLLPDRPRRARAARAGRRVRRLTMMSLTTTSLLLLMLVSTAHAGCRVCQGLHSPTANGTLLPCGPGNGEHLFSSPASSRAAAIHTSPPSPALLLAPGWRRLRRLLAIYSIRRLMYWRCHRLMPCKQDSLLQRAHRRPRCQRRRWLRKAGDMGAAGGFPHPRPDLRSQRSKRACIRPQARCLPSFLPGVWLCLCGFAGRCTESS